MCIRLIKALRLPGSLRQKLHSSGSNRSPRECSVMPWFYGFSLDSTTLQQISTLRQRPYLFSLDCRIAQDTTSSENRGMKNADVVRELVSSSAGENEFFTHYEYGTFRTYQEANECAIATKNPRCFPQREQFLVQAGGRCR